MTLLVIVGIMALAIGCSLVDCRLDNRDEMMRQHGFHNRSGPDEERGRRA
jgi:hypothetical protein